MEANGGEWRPMGAKGGLWRPMEAHRGQRRPKEGNGGQRKAAGSMQGLWGRSPEEQPGVFGLWGREEPRGGRVGTAPGAG